MAFHAIVFIAVNVTAFFIRRIKQSVSIMIAVIDHLMLILLFMPLASSPPPPPPFTDKAIRIAVIASFMLILLSMSFDPPT